jgi:hypothetical protein
MADHVPQQFTKAEDFKSIYSNNAQFTMSPWDVVFVFGENQSVKDNILLVEQKMRVVMSPQHAKIFSQVLSDQVSKYEQTFGPIPVPVQPPMTETQPLPKSKRPS